MFVEWKFSLNFSEWKSDVSNCGGSLSHGYSVDTKIALYNYIIPTS